MNKIKNIGVTILGAVLILTCMYLTLTICYFVGYISNKYNLIVITGMDNIYVNYITGGIVFFGLGLSLLICIGIFLNASNSIGTSFIELLKPFKR